MIVWRNFGVAALATSGLWFALAAQPSLWAEDGEDNAGEAEPVTVEVVDASLAGPSRDAQPRPPASAKPTLPTPTAGGDETPLPPPDLPKVAATIAQGDPIVIVYKSVPYTGWYIGSDSERFTFKLQGALLNKETVLTFTWAQASSSERRVLYRQFGIEAVDDTPVYGRQLEADRMTLKNGMIYYGFVNKMTDGAAQEKIHFTGAQIKLWILSPSEVAKVEKIKVYESQVYSNQEIYTRHKYEGGGLKTAADHFKMAEFCTKLYLPDEGLEHLEMAEAYDDRYSADKDSAIGALKSELKDMSKRKAGDELVRSIDLNYNAHEFGTAKSLAERFMKLFPDHPKNVYVQGLQGMIETKAVETNSGMVVQEIYSQLEDLVREKVATKASQGVVLPGKRIVGNGGQIWEGAVKEETPDHITIAIAAGSNDTKNLKIHKNNIKTIMDVDLNKNNSAKQYPSYQETRQWVDGDRFAKDLFERVAKRLKLPVADVEKYWKERTSGEYEIDKNGNMVAPKDFTRLLSLDVGPGTFLLYKSGGNNQRGGNRQSQLSAAQQQARNQNQGSWSRNGQQVNPTTGGTGANAQQGPDPKDIQPLNETQWWDAAQVSMRVQATMGMVALKFLEPKSTTMYNCPVCSGQGYQVATIDATGKVAYKCCPNCNGNMQLVKLVAK